MTVDKARKSAIRQRMARTGEPYSVARHAVGDEQEAADCQPAPGNTRDEGVPEPPRSAAAVRPDPGGPATPDPVDSDSGAAYGPDPAADRVQAQVEQARRLAGHARELAEHARMRAERADEAATAAEEAADLAEEALGLTSEWADDEEIARSEHRAEEARAAAAHARRMAERADQLAQDAEEAADQAEEAADQAAGLAGDVEDGPEFWHPRSSWPPVPPRPPRPPSPPRPPGPSRVHPSGHGGPDRSQTRRDPADRLHDRLEQALQRFEQVRDQADWLISAAERMFGAAGRRESVPRDPRPADPESTDTPQPR
jgi:hypothetical protein